MLIYIIVLNKHITLINLLKNKQNLLLRGANVFIIAMSVLYKIHLFFLLNKTRIGCVVYMKNEQKIFLNYI